jgi:hypothetical protein
MSKVFLPKKQVFFSPTENKFNTASSPVNQRVIKENKNSP